MSELRGWFVSKAGTSRGLWAEDEHREMVSVARFEMTWRSAQYRKAVVRRVVMGLRAVERIPTKALEDGVVEKMVALLQAWTDETVDYMTRNNLGDPETQHVVKQARALLSQIKGDDHG